MNHSSSVGASIHATCEAIIMAKPVDNIVGQLTTRTMDLLEQQLAQAAGAVPTNQWGGTSGCTALVLTKEPSREATGITNGVANIQAKPALIHPRITKDSLVYERMVKQEEQKEIIQDFDTQKSVDHLLIECIVGRINPQ